MPKEAPVVGHGRHTEMQYPSGRPTPAPYQRYSVLGSGNFGCTLEPRFPCTDADAETKISRKTRPGRRYVSKLLSETEEMRTEEEKYRSVAAMDPEGLFTVPLLGSCLARPRLADFSGKDAKDKRKCKLSERELVME